MRRSSVDAWAAVALLAFAVACGGETPPNVVLVTLDTVGADRLGCEVAPRFCALAERGVRFERALSQSSWTLPSHASILTGLYPHQHRATHLLTPVGKDVPLLAEVLAAEGYATAGFVSGMFAGPRYGLDRGFHHFDAKLSGRRGAPMAGDLTDAALAWTSATNRPFFLWLHYFDPHHDFVYHADQDYPAGIGAETELDYEEWNVPGAPIVGRVAARRDAYDALYAGEIRYTDAQVGRLLDGLEADGALDGAVVVLTADHGESFGEHDLVGHDNLLYRSLVHVPLVVVAPSLEPAIRPDWVETRDIFPTLVELATGVRQERGLFVPRAQAFAEVENRNPDRRLSVVEGRHQLIYTLGKDRVELYDLEQDPEELTNLARTDPERAAALKRALLDTMGVVQHDAATLEELRALGYAD